MNCTGHTITDGAITDVDLTAITNWRLLYTIITFIVFMVPRKRYNNNYCSVWGNTKRGRAIVCYFHYYRYKYSSSAHDHAPSYTSLVYQYTYCRTMLSPYYPYSKRSSVVLVWPVIVLALCHAASRGPCDPLVPQYCLLPFPNSFYTVTATDTDTGLRVNFSHQSFPKDILGRLFQPEEWNGFGL